MTLKSWLAGGWLKDEVRGQVRAALAAESEATFTLGAARLGASERDRLDYDREQVLEQALEAWRVNPLARRMVGLTTQYVVGGGVDFTCKHAPTLKFLKTFWAHPLNRMAVRVFELCDELTRSGNLFLLLSTDAAGMSYVRAVPAQQVKEIVCRENDTEQEVSITLRAGSALEERSYPIYRLDEDRAGEHGQFETVALHYAINRPVGARWGESDLAPVLVWLRRYAGWLEDRARLNRYRQAFVYVVTGKFASEAERIARQNALNANPPAPGSILVCDESERWEIIAARLESGEAGADGLALKKMAAAGAGLPLHFLAEPESSTRSTAEASGGPTYRHFEQRQEFFLWLVGDVLNAAVARRALVDGHMRKGAPVSVQGADISARDNIALAMAASNILAVVKELRDRGLIDDAEMLRLAYRFCGESVDVEELLARGRAEPRPAAVTAPAPPPANTDADGRKLVQVDPASGEVRE